jgi:hypothetical protein
VPRTLARMHADMTLKDTDGRGAWATEPPNYETERALILGSGTGPGTVSRERSAGGGGGWRPQSVSFARHASDDEAPAAAAPAPRGQFLFKGKDGGCVGGGGGGGGAGRGNANAVRALYDYEPQGPEELALAEGDVIEVVSNAEDPWWEGRVKNKAGMFPSNFVERL